MLKFRGKARTLKAIYALNKLKNNNIGSCLGRAFFYCKPNRSIINSICSKDS